MICLANFAVPNPLKKELTRSLRFLFVGLMVVSTSGCVSINLDVEKPKKPVSYAQAKSYLNQKNELMAALIQQLNEQERACYDRFLVSDCVDSLRAYRADYKRAHIEAESAANNIIRLQRYKERLINKSNKATLK